MRAAKKIIRRQMRLRLLDVTADNYYRRVTAELAGTKGGLPGAGAVVYIAWK